MMNRTRRFCQQIVWKKGDKNNEQNAGIIGTIFVTYCMKEIEIL